VVWAWGFFEAVAFFAAFAPAFFFIFMGRNVQQPLGAGQVNANAMYAVADQMRLLST